ncbi:MAG: cyclic nucleotide-binding domain-containing protein [Elusimicrobia bacterium]|nr:cyclic nucleotide-binding domain-containing protein [Elusimicrobiota bacterium]
MNKPSLLKSVFIFEEIEDNLLNELSKQLKEVAFKSGDIVFKENDRADSFFIVDSGRVTISKQLGKEKEKILIVFTPGNVFGEMAFFSDSPRTATAKASMDSKLWK